MANSGTSRRLLHVFAALTLIITVALTGCDEDSIERSIGAQTAAAVTSEYKLDGDPILNAYINNMGQTLVAHSTRQQIPYDFHIIDTDMVNAFAAPYGHIYFLRGLLDFADTEDEVWFIAGHEITHVVKRDSIKSVKKNLLYSLGAALIGTKSDTMGDVAGLGAGLLMLHYSRDDERDADDGGTQLVYSAGYDPNGAVGFFDKLQAKYEKNKPSQLEHLLLTHPATSTRRARQLKRAELDPANSETAVHIARGYQRRYLFGTAAKMLQSVIETNPNDTTAHLGIADSYAAVGLISQARNEYQKAVGLDRNNLYATRQLAALPQAPATMPTIGEAGRQLANAMLGAREQSYGSFVTLNNNSTAFNGIVQDRLKAAIQTSRDFSATVLNISDANPDFTDNQRSAFMVASSAVANASSPVYALEALDSRFTTVAADMGDLNNHLYRALNACVAGRGYDNDVLIAKRSVMAASRATNEFEQAIAQAPAALSDVSHAQAAAAETTTYMQLMAKHLDRQEYQDLLKNAVGETDRLSAIANEAVGKIKNRARHAEARALLARINIAALGTRPELRDVFDGMVAHYTLTRPEDVAALRELGMGHGDAAFALVASRTSGVDPAAYASTLADFSTIDTMNNQGVSLEGPIVILRYLANAMEKELALSEENA